MKREILVKDNEEIVIGRASSKSADGRVASESNLLFNEKTMSKNHGLLEIVNDEDGVRVFVKDTYSQHGIVIHDILLLKDIKYELFDGDKIGFVSNGKLVDGCSILDCCKLVFKISITPDIVVFNNVDVESIDLTMDSDGGTAEAEVKEATTAIKDDEIVNEISDEINDTRVDDNDDDNDNDADNTNETIDKSVNEVVSEVDSSDESNATESDSGLSDDDSDDESESSSSSDSDSSSESEHESDSELSELSEDKFDIINDGTFLEITGAPEPATKYNEPEFTAQSNELEINDLKELEAKELEGFSKSDEEEICESDESNESDSSIDSDGFNDSDELNELEGLIESDAESESFDDDAGSIKRKRSFDDDEVKPNKFQKVKYITLGAVIGSAITFGSLAAVGRSSGV